MRAKGIVIFLLANFGLLDKLWGVKLTVTRFNDPWWLLVCHRYIENFKKKLKHVVSMTIYFCSPNKVAWSHFSTSSNWSSMFLVLRYAKRRCKCFQPLYMWCRSDRTLLAIHGRYWPHPRFEHGKFRTREVGLIEPFWPSMANNSKRVIYMFFTFSIRSVSLKCKLLSDRNLYRIKSFLTYWQLLTHCCIFFCIYIFR